MKLHPILPGAWCVPSAIQALTGADYESVIHPALNRHMRCAGLLDLVTGATMAAAEATLTEMGYRVRHYRHTARHRLVTWAARSTERYPGRALLVATRGSRRAAGHALILQDGRVYDTFTPAGTLGATHPYAHDIVTWCALIEEPR